MAEEKQYTQVRITVNGREKLRRLAEVNRRSMLQQLEWLIDREWREMNYARFERGEEEGMKMEPATAEEPLAK